MERPTKALIDGDILLYSCGFSVEKMWYVVIVNGGERCRYPSKRLLEEEFCKWWDSDDWYEIVKEKDIAPTPFALQAINLKVQSILEDTKCKDYEIYITGTGNFREEVATILLYKGNRDETHKPYHYESIKTYLLDNHNTVIVDGKEADDALGLSQTEDTVICSIDKDLLMIPGWHYNLNSREMRYINEFEGIRNFYIQLLTGDSTDNIPGLSGIGNKRASKILDDAETEEEMFQRCKSLYEKHEKLNQMHEIGTLLWIQQKERLTWNKESLH